jgi:hypothetical protein
MRSSRDVATVIGLFERGHSKAEIARLTGIPRSTIRNWCDGRCRSLEADGSACSRCRQRCLPIPRDAETAYAYLFGQYLGDGGLNKHRRGVYRLVVYGDASYPELTKEVQLAIAMVAPHIKVRTTLRGPDRSCVAIDAYSRSWPCLFPQHGPGMKHERTIELAQWQREITRRYPESFVRGLIHSDGCRTVNTVRSGNREYAYPRYQFSNRSDDIRAIFCEHLDLLGIPWRRMNRWNISVARREGVARLDQFVGPKG